MSSMRAMQVMQSGDRAPPSPEAGQARARLVNDQSSGEGATINDGTAEEGGPDDVAQSVATGARSGARVADHFRQAISFGRAAFCRATHSTLSDETADDSSLAGGCLVGAGGGRGLVSRVNVVATGAGWLRPRCLTEEIQAVMNKHYQMTGIRFVGSISSVNPLLPLSTVSNPSSGLLAAPGHSIEAYQDLDRLIDSPLQLPRLLKKSVSLFYRKPLRRRGQTGLPMKQMSLLHRRLAPRRQTAASVATPTSLGGETIRPADRSCTAEALINTDYPVSSDCRLDMLTNIRRKVGFRGISCFIIVELTSISSGSVG
ncbi:unnamed protein product [Protopolystoma xenopodis]|uniref:Uncharacterized protein n=1 Tax=Protopolystoma xenopodis TaxID=117903 RepID=A0A448WMV4_9PLAT|nr:unnamed protein product [Protopolystoma xenopodis]